MKKIFNPNRIIDATVTSPKALPVEPDPKSKMGIPSEICRSKKHMVTHVSRLEERDERLQILTDLVQIQAPAL